MEKEAPMQKKLVQEIKETKKRMHDSINKGFFPSGTGILQLAMLNNYK